LLANGVSRWLRCVGLAPLPLPNPLPEGRGDRSECLDALELAGNSDGFQLKPFLLSARTSPLSLQGEGWGEGLFRTRSEPSQQNPYRPTPCRRSAHSMCSRTNSDGNSRRAFSASITGVLEGAFEVLFVGWVELAIPMRSWRWVSLRSTPSYGALPEGVGAIPCRRSAHSTCSRTNSDGNSRRAFSASITGMLEGAFPSPTARLRSHRS